MHTVCTVYAYALAATDCQSTLLKCELSIWTEAGAGEGEVWRGIYPFTPGIKSGNDILVVVIKITDINVSKGSYISHTGGQPPGATSSG